MKLSSSYFSANWLKSKQTNLENFKVQSLLKISFFHVSDLCQHNQDSDDTRKGLVVDFIDTLTAPTLRPGAIGDHENRSGKEAAIVSQKKQDSKLTIITPSSVVAVSTAQPHPSASDQRLLNVDSNQKDNNITVSHSVSVVSVKYSFDESGNSSQKHEAEVTSIPEIDAGLKHQTSRVEHTSASIISRTHQQAVEASNEPPNRAPKSIVNVTSR